MKRKNSFYLGWIVGLSFCILGFVFLLKGWIGYGVSLFCILPIVLGLSTGVMPDRKGAIIGLVAALICFFI